MPAKNRIRGPYPWRTPSNGTQDYYVEENRTPSRKVVLYFSHNVLSRATCDCTNLASLQNPCSHVQRVMTFRASTSSDDQSLVLFEATIPPASKKPRRRADSETLKNDEPFIEPQSISSFAEIAPSVLQAVRDEITAIQTSTNVRRILLINGILRGSIAGSYKYEFELEDDFRSPPDTPIELYVDENSPSYSGTIVRCEPDKSVEIALESYIGNVVDQATLESRLDFIWQRAAKRLEEYEETNSSGLIDTVLSSSRQELFDNTLHEDWSEYPPDKEQGEALRMSLRQPVTFVYGPPGTGKSVTIGWLVKELIHRGERIMIASHTNIAVDNALEKALENFQIQSLRESGSIIRLGAPVNNDFHDLTLPKVIEKKTGELQRELSTLRERRNQIALALNTAEEEFRIIQYHRTVLNEYSTLTQRIQSLGALTKDLGNEERVAKETLQKLQQQTLVYSLSDLILWLPRSLRKRGIETQLAEIAIRLDQAYRDSGKSIVQLTQAASKLEDAGLPIAVSEYEARSTQASSEKTRLQSLINDLNSKMQEIQGKIDGIANNIFANVQIIGATLSKICIESGLEKFNCDTLIIDELSTAPFPFVLVALGLPNKRSVLFGDPKQLPSISISGSPAAKFWLQRDTYEIVEQHKDVSYELTWQRRMPPSVVKLVNERMYDGKLRTPPEFEADKIQEQNQPPFEGANVIFVDTSNLNPWSASDPNGSRYNLYSAEIVTEIIEQEIRRTLPKKTDEKVVGVICPYRAQKKLIKKLCETRFPAKTSEDKEKYKFEDFIDFHTVDAFQGEQREIIILDLTAGPPSLPGRLSEESEHRIDQKRDISKVSRLLNVAVTRTKKKLIIIANKDYFERKLPNEGEFVRELIRRANTREEGYRSIDGETFLRSDNVESTEPSRFLDEMSYFTSLRKDFANSKNSVVIISPFVSRRRVEDLKPNIMSMLRRGIKVTVVTKPIGEMEFGAEAIRELESWGCHLKHRYKTHEKIVLIDNRVAYYGSLNTLSHLDTKETMFRFEGEEVSLLIGQFVGVLAPITKSVPGHGNETSAQWLNRDECANKLRGMRYKIGTQRKIPFYAPLYNQTIEYLLDHPPTTEEDLFEALKECGEKQLKHITPFLDEILSILQRYRPS